MRGGAPFDFDKIAFSDTAVFGSSTTACDINPTKLILNDENAATIKSNIMKKLTQFAFTNDNTSFIHTIQCCSGVKGHSDSITRPSNVSTQSDKKENYFGSIGVGFLFEPVKINTDSGEKIYPFTLFDVASASWNPTILTILDNIYSKKGEYKSDPLNYKLIEQQHTLMKENISAASNNIQIPAGGVISLKALYNRGVYGENRTLIENDTTYNAAKNPILCEVILKGLFPNANATLDDDNRQMSINKKLEAGKNFLLLYDNKDEQSFTAAAGGGGNVNKLRYIPYVTQCSNDIGFRDDKFCPYMAGVAKTMSDNTSIISSSIPQKACNTLNAIIKERPGSKDIIMDKFLDVLAIYAFRNDSNAFKTIFKCMSDNMDNTNALLTDKVEEFTQTSNNVNYSLMEIGAVYGNIHIVKPLLDLGVKATDKAVEYLYTRSNVNLDLWFGSSRKPPNSDVIGVQELFNKAMAQSEPDGVLNQQAQSEPDGVLNQQYINKLVALMAQENVADRIDAITKHFEKLNENYSIQNNAVLVTAYANDDESKKYASYLPGDKMSFLSRVGEYAILPFNYMFKGSNKSSAPVSDNDNDNEDDNANGNGLTRGVSYIYEKVGKLLTYTWDGAKSMWVSKPVEDVPDDANTNRDSMDTNRDSMDSMGSVAIPNGCIAVTDGEIAQIIAAVNSDDVTIENTTRISADVKWVIINDKVYDISP
jgi:hypothetical protein